MTYPEPNARPRSFLLPLFLILALSAALLFISNSLHSRVADLQKQADEIAATQQYLIICTNEAVGQLSINDQFLAKQQDAIVKEIKRLSINQETLIIQQIELPEDAE